MNKEAINIELIKDYFAGRLGAKAMHALEKRALEDPFLAEAMEGYEKHFANAKENTDELESRLNERITKKHFRLKPWLVAASVILILGAGTLFMFNNQNKKTRITANEIARNALTEQLNTKKYNTQNIVSHRPDTSYAASSKTIALQKNKKRMDTVKNEPAIADKNNDPTENAAIASLPKREDKAYATPAASAVRPDTISIASALEHQIPSLDIQSSDDKKIQIVDPETGKPLSPVKESLNDVVVVGYGAQKKESLTGAVADNKSIMIRGNATLNHASPLILIDGMPDSLGAVPPQNIASINVLKGGDATALYGTRGANGVLLITTKNRDANNLSFKKSKSNAALSHPQTGWDKFNDYVRTAVKNSDSTGAKGTVMLRFSVLPNGHLSDFKIIRGLSGKRNQQAIDILKNGSLWTYDATSHTGFYTIDF